MQVNYYYYSREMTVTVSWVCSLDEENKNCIQDFDGEIIRIISSTNSTLP
jgi:hypothetical protein